MRGPSLIGFGKRPDFTPAHQVLFDTGIIGGVGGLLLESPIMRGSRTKPVSGSMFFDEINSIETLSLWVSNCFCETSDWGPLISNYQINWYRHASRSAGCFQ
jgi:hypothetical protein